MPLERRQLTADGVPIVVDVGEGPPTIWLLESDSTPFLAEIGDEVPVLTEKSQSFSFLVTDELYPVDETPPGVSDLPPVVWPTTWPLPYVLSLAVGPWTGTDPDQEVVDFDTFTVKWTLHNGLDVTFTVPGHSSTGLNLSGLESDVWVYDAGRLWARGRVLPFGQSWGADGDSALSVTAVGYKRLLSYRHLHAPLTFNQVPQSSIVASLILHAQQQAGGHLGIGTGTLQPGILRDRTEYQTGDNIGQLLGDLQAVEGGPWWDIDHNRLLHVHTYDLFPTHDQPIIHGSNARSMARRPGMYANAVVTTGSNGQTVPAWAEQSTIDVNPVGRWEVIEAHGTVTLQSTLQEHADGLLARSLTPPATWTVEMNPGRWLTDSRYMPGDYAALQVPGNTADPVGTPATLVDVQVQEVTVTVDANGGLNVALVAEET